MIKLRTALIAALAAAIALAAALPANAAPIAGEAIKPGGNALFFETKNGRFFLRACDRARDGHSVIAKLLLSGQGPTDPPTILDEVIDSNGASRGKHGRKGCVYSPQVVKRGSTVAVRVCLWDFNEDKRGKRNRCQDSTSSKVPR